MNRLFFYTKQQFFNFKSAQMAAGFEFLSMSKLLSSQKIESLDEHQKCCVDISSVVGFVKANDSQLLNFEQLFGSFGENIAFICDKAYEKDAKYLFRYIFDDYSDVEAESDEVPIETEEKPSTKPNSVKKITDLDDSELETFLRILMQGYMVTNASRKSSRSLSTHLGYLTNWANIRFSHSF